MIIVIGLPKSGTTSFNELFRNLGYKTIHSHNENHSLIVGELIELAFNENKPLLYYIEKEGIEVITELSYSLRNKKYWPQFNYLYNIIEYYDKIIYILNKRNIQDHIKSLKYFEIDNIIINDNNFEDNIENIIETFYINIKKKLIEYDRKFIEFDIDIDKIDKLNTYIDTKDIDIFPHLNKTNNFITPYPIYIPTPIETNYIGTYIDIPWGLGTTEYEALSGCSGTNLTTSGVLTFNNINSLKINRGNFTNYQDLILQAKPNDIIRLNANFVASGIYNEFLTVFINFGYGYISLGSQGITSTSGTVQWDYLIPSGTPSGNYGLLFYNNFGSPGNQNFASANFYSLHIFN